MKKLIIILSLFTTCSFANNISTSEPMSKTNSALTSNSSSKMIIVKGALDSTTQSQVKNPVIAKHQIKTHPKKEIINKKQKKSKLVAKKNIVKSKNKAQKNSKSTIKAKNKD